MSELLSIAETDQEARILCNLVEIANVVSSRLDVQYLDALEAAAEIYYTSLWERMW